jgi:predicted dinucleotide-binding enzyme
MRRHSPYKGLKSPIFISLAIFLCIALLGLVAASSSPTENPSHESKTEESKQLGDTVEAPTERSKTGPKIEPGQVESEVIPTPSDPSSDPLLPSIPITSSDSNDIASDDESKDSNGGLKSMGNEILMNSPFEYVSKTPDSTFKFPKTKERFIPLNKWKEEKLQYVAKTLSASSAATGRFAGGLTDNGPSIPPVVSNPSEKKTKLDQSLENAPLEGNHAIEGPETTNNPIQATQPDDSAKMPDSEIKTTITGDDSDDVLIKSEIQPLESDVKSGDSHPVSSPAESVSTPQNSLLSKDEEVERVQSAEIDKEAPKLTILASEPKSETNPEGDPSEADEELSSNDSDPSFNGNEASSVSESSSLNIPSATTLENSIVQNVSLEKNVTIEKVVEEDVKVNVGTVGNASSASPSASAAASAAKASQRRLRKNRINYASHDCGAKVLASNDEAVDASAVLVGSKDRYMLNPCSAPRQWIVVELCEEVGIDHIQVGNFEFFSSMIKEVQVLASNSYPTKSWALLGNFTLSNERELQSLDFGEESEMFPEWFKYIKIRILSHWGNEYYCPITEIQVHGLPYVEKLQQELRQNTLELHDIEKLLSESSSNFEALPDHDQKLAQKKNAQKSTSNEKKPQPIPTRTQSSHSPFHHPDTVMPMHEYLEQHKPRATEYFNSLYSSLSNIDQQGHMGPDNLSSSSSSSTSSNDKDHSYDIVHPSVKPPPPRIGADDELDELDDDEEKPSSGSSLHTDTSKSAKDHENSSPPQEDQSFAENPASVGKLSPASAIPTMNLIQLIIQRVKALEISQSLTSAYLGNISSFYRDELAEIGDALAELDQRYYRLMQVVLNTSSTTQAINEAKFASLAVELQSTNEFKKEVFGSLRMYLVISAVLTIIICVMCSFLVVLLLRCLPNSTHERLQSASKMNSLGLLRSNSDIALDQLRRSNSASNMVKVKEDPLANFPISAPSTPPIPLHFDYPVETKPESPPPHAYSPHLNHIRHVSLPAGLLGPDWRSSD